jgi:hypothetical protein
MESLYSSSLALVKQEVAQGNAEVALSFLETYHFCRAIDLQALTPMLPESRRLPQPEKSCTDGGYESVESNNDSYFQSLEVLLQPQEEDSSRFDFSE